MSKVEKNEEGKKKGEGQTTATAAQTVGITLQIKNPHCEGCVKKLFKKLRKKDHGGFEIVRPPEQAPTSADGEKTWTVVGRGVVAEVQKGINIFELERSTFKDKIKIVEPIKAAGSSDKKKTDNGSEEKKKPGEGNGDEKTKKEAVAVAKKEVVAAAEGKKDGGDKKPSQSQQKLREPFNRRDYGAPIPPEKIIGNTVALEPSSITPWSPTTYPDGLSFLKQILPNLPDACSLM